MTHKPPFTVWGNEASFGPDEQVGPPLDKLDDAIALARRTKNGSWGGCGYVLNEAGNTVFDMHYSQQPDGTWATPPIPEEIMELKRKRGEPT